MATPSRVRRVDQLQNNVKCFNVDGTPTPEFIRQWNLLLDLVQNVRQIDGTAIPVQAPIIGGGSIAGGIEPIGLDESGVTAGTYGDASNVPQITVDAFGRIAAAVDVPIAGGAPWTLIAAQALSGNNQYDFTDLDYADLAVITRGVTKTLAQQTAVRVSTDNGSTFFSTSGDYISVDVDGVTTNNTGIFLDNGATASRSGWAYLFAAGITGSQKQFFGNRFDYRFVANLNPINAIRVQTSGGTNFTGGTAYILGR